MLVGRTDEQAALIQTLNEVAASRGSGIVLRGEAGIGKSTLLHVLRDAAIERGFTVASEVGIEGGWAPPYAAWRTLLNHLGLAAAVDFTAGVGETADEQRFRLRQHLITVIRGAAVHRPVLLILDDLQWLDGPSRDLLIPVWRGISTSRVVLAMAWRTPLAEREPDLADLVAALFREPAIRWLEPPGFTPAEVRDLAERLGTALDDMSGQRLASRTNGNPYFVTEVVRLGNDSGEEMPASVRQVVWSRVEALPESTRLVLRQAAIFPRGANFAILREMTELADEALLDAIEPALVNNILRETPGQPEHYAFAHGIVREVVLADWNPGRRVRAHRRAAEVLEATGPGTANAGEIARLYAASRSLPGAEQGLPHALAAADLALAGYDFGQAADLLDMATDFASDLPLARRGEIETRRALALLESLQIDAGERAAEQAVQWLREGGAPSLAFAGHCWRLAHTLNAVDGSPGLRNAIRDAGLAALGERHDLPWARLRLLGDPISVVPHPLLHVARWDGYDPEARRLVLQRGSDEDQAQAIESFDLRTPEETRDLIRRARSWQHPRATLRGLTAAANDLMYWHGQFRQALGIWHEVLTLAERVGAIPWQAHALNQMTLLQVTFGEFAAATASKHRADDVTALLGATSNAGMFQMERDFALIHFLDGDWPDQAHYWLDFAGQPPQGLEAQLAAPLYAAMATVTAAWAGVGIQQAHRLLDALANIAEVPGLIQLNGVVAWGGEAVFYLRDHGRAETYDRLAANLREAGIGDYPQTSLALTRGRLLSLRSRPEAQDWYEQASTDLESQGQRPLLGITRYEQALLKGTSPSRRKQLLTDAIDHFQTLGMTTWLERAANALAGPAQSASDLAGVSKRELEVLRLVSQGYSDRRVADTLFISERTVHAHMRNMLTKTGSTNRTELSSWARVNGILETETGPHSSHHN